MIQLAWRFLLFQKDSALAQWYRARTADARGGTRKTMIVALARKLLIALWRLVTTGEVPAGRRLASGGLTGSRQDHADSDSAAAGQFDAGLPMTIRGGGDPTSGHGLRAAV